MLTMNQCRQALVASARAIWALTVRDEDPGQEPTLELISELWRAVDWQFWLDAHGDGNGGYCETYQEPDVELPDGTVVPGEVRHNKWCGIHIGAAGMAMGDHVPGGVCADVSLRLPVAKYVLPSTLRMADESKWKRHNLELPDYPAPADIIPGDIVTVGSGSAGSHLILISTAPNSAGYFQTIEGNARGRLGDGTSGEGVVVRNRSIREIKRAYRLRPSHFKGQEAPQ